MSEMLDDVIGGLLFAPGQAGPQAQTSTAGGINADTEDPASKLAGCSGGVPDVVADTGSEQLCITHGARASICLVDIETPPELPAAAVASQPTRLAAGGAAGEAYQEGMLVQEAASEGLKPGAELPSAEQMLQPSWADGQATDACTAANPAHF